MLIYNVTSHVEPKIEKEWLLWMKQKHLSEMLATQKFSMAKIFKVISERIAINIPIIQNLTAILLS